jgi:hypothetical protein
MWAREAIQPAMIVFLAVNCVCVGLRVYVRTVISKSFSYDDYAMILAFVRQHLHESSNSRSVLTTLQAGFVVLCACTFVSIKAGYADDQPNPAYDVVTAVKVSILQLPTIKNGRLTQ